MRKKILPASIAIGNYNFIILFSLYFFLITYTNSKIVTVTSEDEFKYALRTEKNPEIVIESSFAFDYYNDNDGVNRTTTDIVFDSNSKTLKISGKSKDVTISLSDEKYNILFDDYDTIEINNLSINGSIHFFNCDNITISSVDWDGSLESRNKKNQTVYINHLNYTNTQNTTTDYGIYFYGGIYQINNSEFYGNKSIMKNILYMEGFKDEEPNFPSQLSINNSTFSGEYECSLLKSDYIDLTISKSSFLNGYSKESGGMFRIDHSRITTNYTSISNGFSEEFGGSFYLNGNILSVYNMEIINCTAIKDGGIFYIKNSNDWNYNIFNNIEIRDIYRNYKSRALGILFSVQGYSMFVMENLLIEDIYCAKEDSCIFFTFGGYPIIDFNYLIVRNVESYDEGCLLIHNTNTFKTDSLNYITNVEIENIVMRHQKYSALLLWTEDNDYLIENVTIRDFRSLCSGITNSLGYGSVYIYDSYIYDSYIHSTEALFQSSSNALYVLDNVSVNNTYFNGALFIISYAETLINNSMFNNIGNYEDSKWYNYFEKKEKYISFDTMLGYLRFDGNIVILNTIINNFSGDVGLKYTEEGSVTLEHSEIADSFFEKGLINITDEKQDTGKLLVYDFTFNNNKAINGPFLNIESKHLNLNYNIIIKNCTFENNMATNYGGVIYSSNTSTNKYIKIDDCYFNNNTAVIGNICFSKNNKSEPKFTNKDKILLNNNELSFVTNPTHIKLNDTIENKYYIFSGDSLPNIIFNLYDDYERLMKSGSELSEIEIGDILFFRIRLNDTYSSKIIGQVTNYCLEMDCTLPNFKIVGNPGVYELQIVIDIFGPYLQFENNVYTIYVDIQPCNLLTHNHQFKDDMNFKSCYKPECEKSCNRGKCVDTNRCDCTFSGMTGEYCNIYYEWKNNKIIEYLLITIASTLIGISIVLFILINIFKNHYIIKEGGGKVLLDIILIGTIFNFSTVIIQLFRVTDLTCILLIAFKNIGFSLIFGSILVKTLRVYNAVQRSIKTIAITSNRMYAIIFGITIFHISLDFIWDNTISYNIETRISNNMKIFHKCEKSKFISFYYIFEFLILASSYYLMYCIRNLKSEFKEPLSIPIYTYIICEIIIIFLENVDSLDNYPPLIRDLFHSICIMTYSVVVLYTSCIKKLLHIRDLYISENERIKQYNLRKNMMIQRRYENTFSMC